MAANRNIVFAVWGSLGDLHPFIAVALKLKQQGFEPAIASVTEYRAKVEAEGIRFHEVRPAFSELERAFGESLAQITHRVIARPDLLYRRLIFPFLRQSYEDMLAASSNSAMLVTSSVCIAARLAAERRGMAWIAAVLQPMMFMSAYDPPALLPGAWLSPLLRRVGPGAAALVLGAAKALVGRLANPVHQFRQEIGLPAMRRDPVFAGQFSHGGALAMYSPLLGAVQPDFPPRTALTGFAFYDSERGGEAAIDPALQRFVAAGHAPLVFTLGSSMVRDPGTFYRESLGAARALQRRAVLLLGESVPPHLEEMRCADVHVCAYAPYSWLFPQCAAVVHQGGVGTLAQAMRAGRAQLIVPFFADQADNAARAVRLGVAATITRSRYTAARVVRELAALLADRPCATRSLAIRDRIALEDGAAAAARVLADRLHAAAG